MDYREILLVNDDSRQMLALAFLLQVGGYQFMSVPDAKTALEELENYRFGLVITRCPRGEPGPVELFQRLKDLEIKVMAAGEAGGNAMAWEALEMEADDYLLLPCHPQLFYRRVAACLGKRGGPISLDSSRLFPEEIPGPSLEDSLLHLAADLLFLGSGVFGKLGEGAAQKARLLALETARLMPRKRSCANRGDSPAVIASTRRGFSR